MQIAPETFRFPCGITMTDRSTGKVALLFSLDTMAGKLVNALVELDVPLDTVHAHCVMLPQSWIAYGVRVTGSSQHPYEVIRFTGELETLVATSVAIMEPRYCGNTIETYIHSITDVDLYRRLLQLHWELNNTEQPGFSIEKIVEGDVRVVGTCVMWKQNDNFPSYHYRLKARCTQPGLLDPTEAVGIITNGYGPVRQELETMVNRMVSEVVRILHEREQSK